MKKIIPVISLAALLATGCSEKKGGSDAEALLQQANAAVEADNGAEALLLLDSLTKNYPSEIETVKSAMQLRPRAIEIQAIADIAECDSIIEAAKTEITASEKELRWVKEERMVEGFWVDSKTYASNFMNTTGIQARVSDIGQFYIVSSANPGVKHTSIAVSDGASESATESVPFDGESNYRIGGGEVITFSPEQSDTIGRFVFENAGKGLTLTFRGGRSKSMKLSPAQTTGIANAYRLARAMESGRNADFRRQKLQRQIELAQSQQKRLAESAQND